MDIQCRHQLADGIAQLELAISEAIQQRLLDYLQMLHKWNGAYNLTAVRDPLQMVSRHLLDSLCIVPFLHGERFLDVGSGAGLPGIVLAIVFPERNFDLLDSNGKKTRFLFQVKSQLGLDNVGVQHSRVEQYQPAYRYQGILSRAFATVQDMVAGSQHLLAEDGLFYAMKGQFPQQELSELDKHYRLRSSHSLTVPGEPGQRHLLLIERA